MYLCEDVCAVLLWNLVVAICVLRDFLGNPCMCVSIHKKNMFSWMSLCTLVGRPPVFSTNKNPRCHRDSCLLQMH